MNTMAPSVWDPSRRVGRSSLKNTPDATPESSLRGGTIYSKAHTAPNTDSKRSVVWTEFEKALQNISTDRTLISKQHIPTEIDVRDQGTPDDWVPRNPALVRLTGRHPFNCEPPVTMLLEQGFITPVSLHYVRTHGRTPRLSWEEHRITIKGLVANPITLSMDELTTLLPTVSLPVTLVCAGNRRKEENMIKKTIGFNWGCAGHACNMWTGVRLCDLLEHCGIDRERARHVAFTGVGNEGLPNGNGTYGTSIDIASAMDRYGDVIIAWEQNGVRLAPDHGFPVRVVIPGWIGGRMVKWLEQIEVTDKPSENHYHYFDNRILPPHVDAELAKSGGWWYKPEYLFNQLNINSAIVYPQNGEVLSLTGAGAYTIKGYAYSGGGRKVSRVEVSFDGGETWELAKCEYPEEKHSHAPANGKYWCWMFWELTVDKFRFLTLTSGEIRCRAWDVASNTQPKDITWNLMGMGNNCHFTVKVQPKQSAGTFALEFLHPTVAGPAKGGWMTPPVPAPAANGVRLPPKKSLSSPALASMNKTLTMAEVAKHDTEESAWIVVEGRVYDCTPYLKEHPGGAASIMLSAGGDATDDFMAIHSDKAKTLLEEYYIGDLIEDADVKDDPKLNMSKSSAQLLKVDLPQQETRTIVDIDAAAKIDLVALHPKKWIEFELVERIEVSHDTRLFKFKLPSEDHRLGLPVGYHMFLQAKIDGNLILRAYTPVSSDDDRGYFTLCIKVYFPNVHPKFPDGGKMSQFVDRMRIGDMLRVKGPLGHFEYKGRGHVVLAGKEHNVRNIGLICGGTGLTPAYQVMQAVYKDDEDDTQIHLLYANKSEEDILMREELERMCAARSNLHVWYTLDSPPNDWAYSSGFINEGMLRDQLPAPSVDTLVGMCGPPPMIKYACIPNLEKLGFKEAQYFSF